MSESEASSDEEEDWALSDARVACTVSWIIALAALAESFEPLELLELRVDLDRLDLLPLESSLSELEAAFFASPLRTVLSCLISCTS